MSTVPLITKQGRELLGQTILAARKSKGWSIDDLVNHISTATGHKISKGTISSLERGNQKPDWDTLAILASTGFIKNPSSGRPYTPSDLFRIASEQISPGSGSGDKYPGVRSKSSKAAEEAETYQASAMCFA